MPYAMLIKCTLTIYEVLIFGQGLRAGFSNFEVLKIVIVLLLNLAYHIKK